MMGEVSSNSGRRMGLVPRGAVLRRRKRNGAVIAPLFVSLRGRGGGRIPASGRIVFRPASQILH